MFRHSIRNKLILFLLIATLVPFITSIVVSYIFTKEKVTEDTITNNSALISQAKLNILNYLNGVVQTSTTIYTGQHLSELGQLYDILEREHDIDYMSDKVIKSGLQVMSHAVKEFKQVYLYASVSDRSFLSSNDFQGSTTGKYKSLRPFPEDKTVYFETTHLSHNYNIALNVYSAPTPVLSMHRKLMYSPNNTSIGELIIDLHLDLISEISQSLYTHDEEELYILDDEGNIVFGPDPSKWGQMLEGSWGNEAIHSTLDKGSYEWSKGAYAGINVYEKMKTDYVSWTIVKRLPYEQLTKNAKQLTLINSLVLTFFMLIVIGGTIYISIRFTEPIKQLIRYITRIQAGQVQLGQMNKDIELTRTDEMGILANRFHGLMQDLNQMVMREYRLELANKSNQLMALQAQINPHFLNNALQSIGTLALQHNAPKVYALISSLAKMMHYSMNTNESVVPLGKELEHVKAYLELQKQRFEHQFHIVYDIEEDTKALSVPKMILQPLVENYFKHGFKPSAADVGLLRIQATKLTEDGYEFLQLVVEDNGIGVTEARLREVRNRLNAPSTGDEACIGLSNVLTRVKLYFTDDAALDIEHAQPRGLRIVIHIPMKKGAI
ncbi:cache domain-containing sensor histidine kinase [Paenibacillus aceris]|uniref:Two-component system sensor histidine kinase YesM n=1 Tax=Paenibacillus aceris TaxID=869555 RepID=A0ABS4HUV2_9BACL|nr:sensor histidine kinase [Paenibacillus aceris]MBP1962348.1 two-component system sensor histidine kinase YesM [Paenibacillus aceris]NHW37167.1 histidine kinase [Paenibacillus aceris]